MKNEVVYNASMHFEHEQWKGELAFWTDEIRFFENRLSEIVKDWTNKDVLAKLEHYQNEFILHKSVIEDMLEEIQEHETRIAGQSKKDINVLDIQLVKKHAAFREKFENQRQIYADLKKDFFRFLEKYM